MYVMVLFKAITLTLQACVRRCERAAGRWVGVDRCGR
jgi:hypothetical protein